MQFPDNNMCTADYDSSFIGWSAQRFHSQCMHVSQPQQSVSPHTPSNAYSFLVLGSTITALHISSLRFLFQPVRKGMEDHGIRRKGHFMIVT